MEIIKCLIQIIKVRKARKVRLQVKPKEIVKKNKSKNKDGIKIKQIKGNSKRARYCRPMNIWIVIPEKEKKRCTNKNSRKKSFWKSFIKRRRLLNHRSLYQVEIYHLN